MEHLTPHQPLSHRSLFFLFFFLSFFVSACSVLSGSGEAPVKIARQVSRQYLFLPFIGCCHNAALWPASAGPEPVGKQWAHFVNNSPIFCRLPFCYSASATAVWCSARGCLWTSGGAQSSCGCCCCCRSRGCSLRDPWDCVSNWEHGKSKLGNCHGMILSCLKYTIIYVIWRHW